MLGLVAALKKSADVESWTSSLRWNDEITRVFTVRHPCALSVTPAKAGVQDASLAFNGLLGSGPPTRESNGEVAVTKVDQLKADIEKLPSEDFSELCQWLREADWERWDRQVEADSDSGALDFLIREAHEEKAKGALRDL